MALPPNWQQQVLRGIGAPVTPQNLQFLNQWHQREGGGDKNNANFNPLNTTQNAPGAGSINSVNVRSYISAGQGIKATVQTLLNGHYGDIVSGLRQNVGAARLAASPGLHTWGTGTWSASKPPVAQSGGSPALRLAGALRGNGGSTAASQGNIRDLAAQYFLQASNDAAAGRPTNGNQLLQLAFAKQALGQQQITPVQSHLGQVAIVHGSGKGTSEAISLVKQAIGTPYVWGGSKPGGFDCSGLLQWAWGKSGVKIPRTTYDQWKVGAQVGKGQLRAGDAVFFKGSDSKGGLPGHVGMYIGNGKFIEAPHSGAVVHISNLAGRTDFMGARRY